MSDSNDVSPLMAQFSLLPHPSLSNCLLSSSPWTWDRSAEEAPGGPQAHPGCWSASCLSPALVTRCCHHLPHASVLPWTLHSICKACLWFLLVKSNLIISPTFFWYELPQHTLHPTLPMLTWPTLFVTLLLCLQTELPTSVAASRPPIYVASLLSPVLVNRHNSSIFSLNN